MCASSLPPQGLNHVGFDMMRGPDRTASVIPRAMQRVQGSSIRTHRSPGRRSEVLRRLPTRQEGVSLHHGLPCG